MTKKTKNVQSIRAIVRLALLVLITEVGFNAQPVQILCTSVMRVTRR